MDLGFVDLRRNIEGENPNASFWPSFTDIMTVIVMIFMLASTVLIVRNWELVEELRSTMQAEREAAQLAQQTRETNQSLEEQLERAIYELSLARDENRVLRTQLDEQSTQLTSQQQALLALRTDKELLQEGVTVLERQLAMSREEELRQRQRVEALTEKEQQQSARIASLLATLEKLEAEQKARLAELGELRQQQASQREQMSRLEGDYSSLKEKYDRLVRPARTVAGKQVVEVRYRKSDGKAEYDLREAGQESFRQVSAEQLHQALGKLKQRFGDRLYVKIIIPSDSGLSYSEAWAFTKKLLYAYDYYYQDEKSKN